MFMLIRRLVRRAGEVRMRPRGLCGLVRRVREDIERLAERRLVPVPGLKNRAREDLPRLEVQLEGIVARRRVLRIAAAHRQHVPYR